jgi:hypothetical protein
VEGGRKRQSALMDATNPFEAGRQSGRSACGADLAEWNGRMALALAPVGIIAENWKL